MGNLSNILASVGKDKYIHFTLSLVLTLALFIIGYICGLGVAASIPAFFITLLVGVLKEKHDKKTTGLFDHYDIVADFLGAFLGIVFISLFITILI